MKNKIPVEEKPIKVILVEVKRSGQTFFKNKHGFKEGDKVIAMNAGSKFKDSVLFKVTLSTKNKFEAKATGNIKNLSGLKNRDLNIIRFSKGKDKAQYF